MQGEQIVVCRSFDYGQLSEGWDADQLAGYSDEISAEQAFSNLWSRFVANLDPDQWNAFPNLSSPFFAPDGRTDFSRPGLVPTFSGTLESTPMMAGNRYQDGPIADQKEGDFVPPNLFFKDRDDTYISYSKLESSSELVVLPETIGFHNRSVFPHIFSLGNALQAEGVAQGPIYQTDSLVFTCAFQSPQRLHRVQGDNPDAVSYTHLTLPTKA